MNNYHQQIIQLFSKRSGNYTSKQSDFYVGSRKYSYAINNPTAKKMIKEWVKVTPLTFDEYKDLLDNLSRGESYNEFITIGSLLNLYPKHRRILDPESVAFWLENAQGWAEIDSICQNNFTYTDMLTSWTQWKKVLESFADSKDLSKRRACLVLLTGPVHYSSDIRFSDLAFENIIKLKNEKDILITKAISWLLRSLITYHRNEVEEFLKKHSETLPRIAIRETINKLKSGRKSGKISNI